jgi:hypothetical protein
MAELPDKCVVLCESVHDVMALERALKDAGIAVEMIPTPRELTSDCGMALEISTTDAGKLPGLRDDRPLSWLGVYRRHGDRYLPLDEP